MSLTLLDAVPNSITVHGRRFKCNFDFRNVLKMLDIMQRNDLQLDARDYLCVKCIISHRIPSKIVRDVYVELCNVLFPKAAESTEKGKKLMSFKQDAPLIRAAFLQVYGINLFHARLTWFEFTDLLHGLPEGCLLMNVISIRSRELPPPKPYNQSEREWLIKAKRACALQMTEQEQAENYNKQVENIFNVLLSMIPPEKRK